MGQGRGVVDAVSHHSHDLACVLEAADLGRLAVGEHVGQDALYPDLGGHSTGGALVVTGQQHRGEAEGAQFGDGLAAGGLHPVGEGDQSSCLVVPGGPYNGRPFSSSRSDAATR